MQILLFFFELLFIFFTWWKAAVQRATWQFFLKETFLNDFLQILSLQDQLENGPNAQLARLEQENKILRDALNQATSQAESKWVIPSNIKQAVIHNARPLTSLFWY